MICDTCGNEIDDFVFECPYCGAKVNGGVPAARTGMVTVRLKDGQPTVDVARDRLDAAIRNQHLRGVEGLLLIHGYGSSGEGGKIRRMVHERLEQFKYEGSIRDFVPGEQLGRVSAARLPASYTPSRKDLGNEGITIVKLA